MQLVEADSKNILMSELKRYERMLFPHQSESGSEKQDEDTLTIEDKMQDNSASEGVLKITLHVLKEMGHRELANKLEKRKYQDSNE